MTRSAHRLLLLGGVALTVAVPVYLVVDRSPDPTESSVSGPAAGPSTSPAVPRPAEGAVPDPRATAVPVTEAPEDVVTDEPVPPADGEAEVLVTFAGWEPASRSVQVNAYVSGAVEDGGTCTLELSGDGGTRTASAPASADATTTICDLLEVPGSDLAAGPWQVVVSYESASTTGTSETEEVTVP